ncbi:universal stress protein [Kribbella solani]|uniref:Nucleotide-binding universal stress UspA family protein n=1 Tax=Kribbella solani TaxID=236067 RepID=A0A841DPV2_9ACTN|nr:universal stress protein [Kribbella solani]MBB5978417.1 nucleotide-binding universal stress UspA family protein [Kribbella solani]
MKHKPVVVGIDGSPAAGIAIRWGAIEAAALRGPLHLVYALTPGGSPSLAGDVVYKAVAQARGLEPGIVIDSRIETGPPSAALVKASGTAAVVVIGSRGLGVMLGALVGSTGLDLAANAHCPVVVVRPDLGTMAGIRVVIGYDGSPDGDAALVFGIDYARRHKLAVRVVAAQPAGTELHRITEPELRAAVHRRGGHDAELVQITGHPAEHILRLAADANLIVLGARGRGGFAGMLIGSVSQTVLHHADCPVAMIPTTAVGG